MDPFPDLEPMLGHADPFDAILRSLAETRVADAAAARTRARWLVRQAEEEGTVAGVLIDLAERREPLVITTISARRHTGTVTAIGADFVALRGAGGSTLLVRLAAVATVRTRPGTPPVSGDRPLRLERRFHEVLTELAGDRPSVLMGTGAGEINGQLHAVGRDLATVRVEGSITVYVPIDATSDVWVR